MLARAVIVTTLLFASWAAACPTCACGNPALTSMGAEQPTVNRVRLATTLRAWQQDEGSGVDATRLREMRLDLSVSFAPTAWLSLAVNVPVQLRERLASNLERQTAFGWGEAELSARLVLFGANELRPKALISAIVGTRLPTALSLHDGARQLDGDAQLGPGGIAPQLGLAWSGFFGDRWSAMASLLGEVPLTGRYGFRMGPSAVLIGLGQFQPVRWFGVRAGIDVRGELPTLVQGVPDARLSGVIGSALGDVVFRLGAPAVLLFGIRVPVVDTRPGPVHTWPMPVVSFVVDV